MVPGVFRVTFAIPFGIDHVHCYLVASDDGWTVVDTGLGLPDAREQWERVLDGIDVARIFITHFHPDHVGGAADVAELTGAPVLAGRGGLRAVPPRLGRRVGGAVGRVHAPPRRFRTPTSPG